MPIVWIGKGYHCVYVPFLRDWYKRTKKYEMRTQTSVDNTVNDLHYEIKFENCVKDKNNFIKQNIAFLSWTKIYFILEDIFFEIPWNLITSAFFLPRQILKNIRYPSAKVSNADWIIKNDHEINCAMFFRKWFEHDQTSNIIWLSTT